MLLMQSAATGSSLTRRDEHTKAGPCTRWLPCICNRKPFWECVRHSCSVWRGADSQGGSGEGSHDWPYSSMMSG